MSLNKIDDESWNGLREAFDCPLQIQDFLNNENMEPPNEEAKKWLTQELQLARDAKSKSDSRNLFAHHNTKTPTHGWNGSRGNQPRRMFDAPLKSDTFSGMFDTPSGMLGATHSVTPPSTVAGKGFEEMTPPSTMAGKGFEDMKTMMQMMQTQLEALELRVKSIEEGKAPANRKIHFGSSDESSDSSDESSDSDDGDEGDETYKEENSNKRVRTSPASSSRTSRAGGK